MNKIAIWGVFAAALMLGPVASAQLPGPVMSVSATQSQLPEAARKFMDRNFKGVVVRSLEFEPGRGGSYEVELANGIELEFDSQGALLEISARRNAVLPESLVKNLVPPLLFSSLVTNGVAAQVEDIEFRPDGRIEVDTQITDPDTFVYDAQGNFLRLKR